MHSIEVAFSDEALDSAGISAKKSVSDDLGIPGIEKVRCSEVYYLELRLEEGDGKLRGIAEKVFTDPIVQSFSVDHYLIQAYDFMIEVGFNAGVTDNLAIVAREAIGDYLGREVPGKISTARRYYITGGITAGDAERIAREMLANGVIESYKVEEWR